ncbi:hypothetical protein [Opitutus sp. GAS368]|uniref:hypothetical protein n=1 Tax=Opitutus sp. GAS368 TaxID=1882749 RepID=UPI00087BB075|nr:hypothetical protein [Opitutus sp. GAS368]SDS00363.1 hypothetical protein SAMN05444173_1593 [Opitutus sp. GAS368]
MKKAAYIVSRVLLGLMFLIFGLNGFLNFIPQPPPTGVAGQFLGAMFVSHYLVAVFALQVIAGGLLLLNRFVRAALVILAPLLVNIVLFHLCMAPAAIPPALIGIALWSVVFYQERVAFSPLLAAKGNAS